MSTIASSTPKTSSLESLLDSFSLATGLPLQFYFPGEFTAAGNPHAPAFCRVMENGYKSGGRCREVHLKLQDPEGKQTRSVTCFAGLTSSAMPVVRGETLIGYLHVGHVWVDRHPGCGSGGRDCILPGRKERGCSCPGACRQMSCVTGEKYAAALSLVQSLANQVANFHSLELKGKPYPAIDRIIGQVRADVVRNWRTSALARQAGMHPSYFSEKFHRRTGQTFSRFLASLRVERARQLLAFTALPVCEIAFASGFRSLSQFNRMFKKVTGHSPGKVRRGFPEKIKREVPDAGT